MIRQYLRSAITCMCEVDYPTIVYENDYMNSIPTVSTQQAALFPCIGRIRAEVKRQQEEQFLAVLRKGQYFLMDEFSFLEYKKMTYSDWMIIKKGNYARIHDCASFNTMQRKGNASSKIFSLNPENTGIIDVHL